MPSIGSVQREANSELEGFASFSRDGIEAVELTITGRILAQYGAEFKDVLNKLINQKKLVATGNLADIDNPEIDEGPGITTMRIRLADYYDFVNKGVKGVKSSRNAPDSPYQFRNYGVGTDMRRSLTQYVQQGRFKIRNVRRDAALGTGLERKGVKASTRPTIEQQVNQLGYLIKAYGIKETGYFDDAFNQVFSNFEVVMTEAVGQDIILTLSRKL